jgi:hypothetical protein
MAINLSDNVHVSAPKPVESKYLNITVPYTGTSQVNTCIVSGERYRGLTVNISNIEYWYKTGVTDTALVTKSAGGTWGSITGTLSGQTDLQTCLNGKLASGGTAICATTAGNALKLNNQAASFYLNTGSTALCAITAGNALCLNGHTEANLSVANSACLGGKLPAYYLNTGSTALCATTAGNALCLGSKLPAYYLNTGSTITCAADSAKLNNKLPAYYLNTGSTALCSTSSIDSKGLCGCVPTCFLGATSTAVCATCAIGSKSLCGCVPASFLLSGGTAICATCAGNASTLVGCTPSCFLGATACACDSKCLGGHLPAYYFASGGTALCATTAGNSLCLGGVLPAGYLLSGGTAKNSLCLNGHTEAALSVCNSVCVNGHAEAALSVCCAQNSANLGGVLAAGYLLSGGTAKNSLCLNGHLEAALSVCNSVCVNGHAESALSVANAACLGGNLANTYAPLASPNFTTCICTPVMCSTGVVKGTVISGSTCVESPVIQLTTGAAAGCVFTSNAAGCGVWCTPAAGGLAWSGSTANGVGTYYSASKICSNANMTFDGTKLGVTGNICASTCLCSPIVFGTTCLCGGIVCATTIATAACTIGTTCLCSPVVLGSTCVCGAIVCSNTCIIAGTCVTGTVACFSSCVRSPLISGGTVCATGNMTAICFVGILCGTACCATIAGNALCLGDCLAANYLCFGANDLVAKHLTISNPAGSNYDENIRLPYGPGGWASIMIGGGCCIFGTDANTWGLFVNAGDFGIVRGTSTMTSGLKLSCAGIMSWCGGVCLNATCGIATDWIATSDCRLKTCIKPIMGALSTVMQLQGVCYQLCGDETHENNIGLIAQSVQKVLPEVVSHSTPNENDAKYGITDDKLGISYGRISSILIEAIKEQQLQIEEQQKQIICLRYDLNYWRNYNC